MTLERPRACAASMQSLDAKLDYTVGFFDGMEVGNKFSYWGIPNYEKSACSRQANDSIGSMTRSSLPTSQMGKLWTVLTNSSPTTAIAGSEFTTLFGSLRMA